MQVGHIHMHHTVKYYEKFCQSLGFILLKVEADAF